MIWLIFLALLLTSQYAGCSYNCSVSSKGSWPERQLKEQDPIKLEQKKRISLYQRIVQTLDDFSISKLESLASDLEKK